ncbi:putative calreticulin [Trypanosoma theileri]|uniref:Calreticulin n=1 Tax=Trypanosoma theileri TaxID=67003 RepID=A0A1X0NIG9_9TRYP|nr:putative calreticulin [Trypanosoma theileri]ORC84525.1 putative calreticulin [Trypanosoma theileri]
MRAIVLLCALLGLSMLVSVNGKILFHEDFSSLDKWVQSKERDDYGKVELSAGKNEPEGSSNKKGLRLTEDARFYAISTEFPTPISNENKELVFSFVVKHEQDLKCGGAYLKYLPAMDPTKFNGESKYWLMFGPDRCGSKNKVHIILHYNGVNHEWSKNFRYPEDSITHAYTLRIAPDNSYSFYLDGQERMKGTLEEDWSLLPAKEIADPSDVKPADWVDEPTIVDPNDVKPADWDNEPAMIPDTEAKRPDDWDDAEDGEWEAPMVPNPNAKGEWHPKRIPNPAYKGEWAPRMIPNPEYKEDKELYKVREPLAHVGIDVWQVESGSIFRDIIIGDDVNEVLEMVKKTVEEERKKEEAEKEKKEADAKKEEEKKEGEKKEADEDKGDL